MKNTFVKVLSMMMALMMVVGAFSMITVSAADCAHENCTETVVAPNCEDAGFTKVLCNDCGVESIKDIVPATGKHNWETVPGTPADCDEPAYKAYKKCTACGKTEGEKTPVEGSTPNGHSYNIPVTQEATCDKEGFTSKKCAVCGDIDKGANYNKTADAGHKYVYTVVTAATACLNGTYNVTCENCDLAYQIHDTDKKHTPVTVTTGTIELAGEGNVVVGSGCGAKYKELKYCDTCKVKLDAKANDNLGHNPEYITGSGANKTLTSLDINEQIIAQTGLQLGDPTEVPATLNTDGYRLYKCKTCGVYVKEVIGKTINHANGNHTWVDVKVVAGADHTQNSIKHEKCSFCGLTKETSLNDAKPHNYVKADGKANEEKVEMTCISNGYTRHFCTLCSYYYDDAIVYKTGHTFGDWTYSNCVGGTMTRTCVNKYCSKDATSTETKASDRTEHDFEVKPTAATCMDDAFAENVCKICKFNAGTADVKQPAAGVDASNHVIKDMQLTYAGSDVDQFLAVVQPQSCTNPEISKWACACGVMVTVKTKEAAGHTIVEGQKKTFNAGASNEFTLDFRALDSDCNTQGQSAGKFCSVCGAVETLPVAKPVDLKKHDSDATWSKIGETIPANCVSVAIERMYWSCCGEIIPTEAGTTKNPNYHPNATKINEVAATCLATGMQAYYYCADCKVFMTVSGNSYNAASAKTTLAALNIVIPMLSDKADRTKGQHNWDKAKDAVAEQCTVAGTKSYQECKDCAAWLVDGVVVFDNPATDKVNEQAVAINIDAHGSAYVTNLKYKNGTPNCNTGAYQNIPDALICEKCGSNGSDGISFHAQYWVGPTAHNPETIYVQTTASDCTQVTFAVERCKICKAEWALGYTSATVKGAHKFTNDEGEYLHKVDTKAANCSNAGYSVYKCDNCAVTTTVIEAAPIGHHHVVNGVKMPLSFSCVDFAANKGLTCVDGCGKTVRLDDPNTPDVNENTVTHNRVTSKKDATCTEDGYYVEYCKDCNKTFVATTENKKGHSDKSVLIEVANGVEKYNCPVCGEYWTKAVVPAVVETYTVSAEKVAAGETFTVTYALSGAATEFSAKNLNVAYDATRLTFVGIQAADINGLYAVASEKRVYDEVNDEYDYFVGVSLIVANDANNTAQKVTTTAEGTVLFTLTFVANKTASGTAAIANKTVAINALGNLNGDGIVTAEDAQAIFAKIGTDDVAADVNLDGVVTLADVIALAKFAASAKTVADYYEMVGELDKLESEVFAIYEAGRINDVNGDGIANIADAYELINVLEAAMTYEYSELGNIVTMAELVALANKYA